MNSDTTTDAFLGGKLQITQPRKGYRAGTDPVLLAAAVDAHPGQTVLDLGCGVGTAALCLNARVGDLELSGVEFQPEYAELAQINGAENGARFNVVCADLRDLPVDLRQKQFHHVLMNPPYFERTNGSRSADAGRDKAFGGDTPLKDWIDVGVKRLAPRGYFHLIQKIERLPEILGALESRLGSIIVRPIAPRIDTSANLFILHGRQDGKAAFKMLAPLIMHEGTEHLGDFESYTPTVKRILRDAHPIGFDVNFSSTYQSEPS